MPAALVARAVTVLTALGLLTSCASPTPDEARTPSRQYLAIGDSYTAGYRPAVDGGEPQNTTDGFAWRVAEETGLELVNVSCSGITAKAFVSGDPCDDDLRAPGALPPSESSELQVALDHLDEHGDEVDLVTVVLGANDLRRCDFDDPAWGRCASETTERTVAEIDTLLGEVRERIGADVPIVGLTYPDVWLGLPVLRPDSKRAPAIAQGSVEMFRTLVNPGLRSVYEKHGATFVDVTEAFGAYLSPIEKVPSREFGELPERTVRICDETYFCALGDPHPTPEGHRRIADLVVAQARP